MTPLLRVGVSEDRMKTCGVGRVAPVSYRDTMLVLFVRRLVVDGQKLIRLARQYLE